LRTAMGDLIILTGEIGAGKSTWCQALCQAAKKKEYQVCGVISPARFADGEKTGIELLDLTSGERRVLAEKRAVSSKGQQTRHETRHWRFIASTLTWGEACLNALLQASHKPCDLLIIDEMGPLEFEHQQGWLSGLRLVDSRNYRLACVSIRPALLQAARLHWSWGQVVRLTSI
jgi:nucleoside-triphosphatase THEP1